jgi:hypothetical protein
VVYKIFLFYMALLFAQIARVKNTHLLVLMRASRGLERGDRKTKKK